jgi:hypothetical protein
MRSFRELLIAVVGFIAGTTLGGAFYHNLPGREDRLQREIKDDAAVIEALTDENASLKEENDLQRKLIDAYKAERGEIKDKTGPET